MVEIVGFNAEDYPYGVMVMCTDNTYPRDCPKIQRADKWLEDNKIDYKCIIEYGYDHLYKFRTEEDAFWFTLGIDGIE